MDPQSMPELPPELFPLIASFLPLRTASQTLLFLALVNRDFYDIIHPLIYSRLILRNEDDAIAVIQRILVKPHLGLAVTELHLMSELSVDTRKGKKPFDALVGLQRLVERKLVPRLAALSIYLLEGWRYDEDWKPIAGHGRLLLDFWRALRVECPRLRSLALRNVGHGDDDNWLSGAVIDEINSYQLSSLRLEFACESAGPSAEDFFRILKNLPLIASSLQTLDLTNELMDTTPILSLDFPSLQYLSLHYFKVPDTASVMAFFRRHSHLESLSLVETSGIWFTADIGDDFLPRLTHLKARFNSVRCLASILPRLSSLSFFDSYNAQVPYLLRNVLPHGLPRLKSLEIQQYVNGWQNLDLEGALWYETLDGDFRTDPTGKMLPRNMVNGFMHSIVRSAPNLEELGIRGRLLHFEDLDVLAPTLSQFSRLKRFYYNGFAKNPRLADPVPEKQHPERIEDFIASAEMLAHICVRLESVTSIAGRYLPYLSGAVERDTAGEVVEVKAMEGVGMQIPADADDPFPCNI
ncbi:hypothetical protein BDN70DRAFT_922785 [Pholiota conissans]|uniref:F-box domain-containing protein n=1 Tax=Pholiota conissans TaxID=109636 RepID=A0A9P6CRL0_9AGAR|nr:hypothetical protein BDN70DRAFT_922785 [Pholiota conissans]